MSLILDALNKADREENTKGLVPDLNTVHSDSGYPVSPFSKQFIVLGAGVGVAVLLLVVILLMFLMGGQRDEKPQAPVDSKAKTTVTQAPDPQIQANTQAPKPKQRRPRVEIPVTEDVNPEIAALYAAKPVATRIIKPSSQPPATVQPEEPTSQSTIDEGLARALWESSKIAPPPIIPSQAQPTTITPTPQEVMEEVTVDDVPVENTLAAYSELPFLHNLAPNFQSNIPTLMYSDHQYINGYVVINQQTIQAGEMLQGVEIQHILSDGIVVKYNNRTFKLSSLSSWINF